MVDGFAPLDPASFKALMNRESIRARFRISIWHNGRCVGFWDYMFEGLADQFAQELRDKYKQAGARGVFVKKERRQI